MKLRVLLVDDHPIIREGVKSILQRLPDFDLIGEAASIAEARPLVKELQPDLLILNVRLPDGPGVVFAAWALKQLSNIRILMVSEDGYNDRQSIRAALRVGVHGYLARSESVQRFSAALSAIARGQRVYPELEASSLSSASPGEDEPAYPRNVLSARELEVARLVQAGRSDRQIAAALHLSVHTVHTHLTRIRGKLGACNRVEIAAIVARLSDSALLIQSTPPPMPEE